MQPKNKFEQQLHELISEEDVHKELDSLDDEYEQKELLPVVYEEKQSNLEQGGDLENDYKFARSNLYGLIGRTNAGIDAMLKVAAMSEHPRAFEVLSNLLKTSSDITKDLLELQKKLDKDSGKKDPLGKYVQNNNYYGVDPKDKKTINSELDNLDDD